MKKVWEKYGISEEHWQKMDEEFEKEEKREKEEREKKEEVDYTNFQYSELKKLIGFCKKDKKSTVLLKKLEKIKENIGGSGSPIGIGVWFNNFEEIAKDEAR
jgi:DNA repair ATPase RecN